MTTPQKLSAVTEYGVTIVPDQSLTDFRGDVWHFVSASRPTVPGKSGKVIVKRNGATREFYAGVFDLTVIAEEPVITYQATYWTGRTETVEAVSAQSAYVALGYQADLDRTHLWDTGEVTNEHGDVCVTIKPVPLRTKVTFLRHTAWETSEVTVLVESTDETVVRLAGAVALDALNGALHLSTDPSEAFDWYLHEYAEVYA